MSKWAGLKSEIFWQNQALYPDSIDKYGPLEVQNQKCVQDYYKKCKNVSLFVHALVCSQFSQFPAPIKSTKLQIMSLAMG